MNKSFTLVYGMTKKPVNVARNIVIAFRVDRLTARRIRAAAARDARRQSAYLHRLVIRAMEREESHDGISSESGGPSVAESNDARR